MTIKQMPPAGRKVGTPVVARIYGVGLPKVHYWIEAGLLKAVDVRSPDSTLPQYRIDLDDLPALDAAIAVHSQADGGAKQ